MNAGTDVAWTFSYLHTFINYYDTYRKIPSSDKEISDAVFSKIKETWKVSTFCLLKIEAEYSRRHITLSHVEKVILAESNMIFGMSVRGSDYLIKSFNLYYEIGDHQKCRELLEMVKNMNYNEPQLSQMEQKFSRLCFRRGAVSQDMAELDYAINPLVEYVSGSRTLARDPDFETITDYYFSQEWIAVIQAYESRTHNILESEYRNKMLDMVYRSYVKLSKEEEGYKVRDLLQKFRFEDIHIKLRKLFDYFERKNDSEGQEWVVNCLEGIGAKSEIITDMRQRIMG